VEAQLKKALTIAVKVQANRKKRKADHFDDKASPSEKLQRLTDNKSIFVAVVTRILLDCANKLSNVIIVTSGITMFVLVLRPVMLNLSTSFARIK
jgi:L-aminopeptidase/D-esterase-like protein